MVVYSCSGYYVLTTQCVPFGFHLKENKNVFSGICVQIIKFWSCYDYIFPGYSMCGRYTECLLWIYDLCMIRQLHSFELFACLLSLPILAYMFSYWSSFHVSIYSIILSFPHRLKAVIFLQLVHIMLHGTWYLFWMFLDYSILRFGFLLKFSGKPCCQLTKQQEIPWGMKRYFSAFPIQDILLIDLCFMFNWCVYIT